MSRQYYSQRKGTNPNLKGLPLIDTLDLFVRVFAQLREDGYFDEAFGFVCVDAGEVDGKIKDAELEMLLTIRKKGLWPVKDKALFYKEDDFFDVLEFLYQHVSKPIDGTMHSYAQCGMHWETFNQTLGRAEFCTKVNAVLAHYEHRYELSPEGDILHKPEAGFEPIFDADLPPMKFALCSASSLALTMSRKAW